MLPSVLDVDRMLRALGVDQATCIELLALARVANSEYQDVRASVRRGLHHRQRELAALESDSGRIRHFLPTLITGLLQTPEYMHAAMNTPVGPAMGDTERAVALKLKRQSILFDRSKHFKFLLTENAIRWQLCEPVIMAVQIDRLVSLSLLSNICIGILPLHAHVRDGAYHTFVIYDERLVTIELFTGQLVLRDPRDVDHYQELFTFFSDHSLWGDDARSFLADVSDGFRTSN